MLRGLSPDACFFSPWADHIQHVVGVLGQGPPGALPDRRDQRLQDALKATLDRGVAKAAAPIMRFQVGDGLKVVMASCAQLSH